MGVPGDYDYAQKRDTIAANNRCVLGGRYTHRQRAADREYLEAWEKLTPEQRAALSAGGVDGPDLDIDQAKQTCRDEDAGAIFSNRLIHSTTPDMAAEVDRLPEWVAEEFGLSREQGARVAAWHQRQLRADVQRETSLLLNRIIGFMLIPGNLLIRVHALVHAARMASTNGLRSLRHSAEVCAVSVEAIRKVAWRWVELLGLPPLEGAKSDEARAKYSDDKKNNHWRNQKCKPSPMKTNGNHKPETPAAAA